jgi:hypothetical protein
LFLAAARQAVAEKRYDDAEAALRRASAAELPARWRLHGLVATAALWQEAGQRDRVALAWRAVQGERALREMQMEAAGLPRRGPPPPR